MDRLITSSLSQSLDSIALLIYDFFPQFYDPSVYVPQFFFATSELRRRFRGKLRAGKLWILFRYTFYSCKKSLSINKLNAKKLTSRKQYLQHRKHKITQKHSSFVKLEFLYPTWDEFQCGRGGGAGTVFFSLGWKQALHGLGLFQLRDLDFVKLRVTAHMLKRWCVHVHDQVLFVDIFAVHWGVLCGSCVRCIGALTLCSLSVPEWYVVWHTPRARSLSERRMFYLARCVSILQIFESLK